ncbi:hypothetical protein [Evansella cellulosilytica]|uniref:Uncharacterized protein n=1 Tax=Evansella cellulosilytica (strain ATCC 21833 / DSM 2522 / FERM P-1141 / JCM 9156 / N-4) TaxID=649639 RepID=E6TZT6_EVAC2|nr:hypothetical protein [Evansella cellulosilytica]ADU32502.1 hypothetical protein Bcell_4275 [Evansella cellulosilytica DSM 2522]
MYQNNEQIKVEIREIDRELSNLEGYANISLKVSRENVERGRIQKHLNFVNQLEKNKDIRNNSLMIFFDGYENDAREIIEIPEVRKWVSRLFKKKPHIFYYLSDNETISIFLLCISKSKIVKSDNQTATYEITLENHIITKIMTSAIAHSRKRGDSIEKQEEVESTILFGIIKNSM